MATGWRAVFAPWIGLCASAACGSVASVEHGTTGGPSAGGRSGGASSSGGRGAASAGSSGTSAGGGLEAGGAGAERANGSGGSPGSTGGRSGPVDASVSADAGIPPGPPTTCSFDFAVTTVTSNGRYAPRNAGAIWIETAPGSFVKTLEYWGAVLGIRPSYAAAWYESSKGNLVDAVTAATRTNHGPLDVTWNCTDTSEHPVPRGSYRVCVTVAEDNQFPFLDAGPLQPVACIPFTVGSGPFDSSPPDAPPFIGLRVSVR